MSFNTNIDPVDARRQPAYICETLLLKELNEMFKLEVIPCAALMLFPTLASAQTDEIQVYDGGLAEPGKFNLTLHQNFTPIGQKSPLFPAG